MADWLLIGTYSEPILFGTGELFCGHGEGLYLCALEGDCVRVVTRLKLGNPSFFAVNEEKRHIYAVNEMKTYRGAYGGGLTDIVYEPDASMRIVGEYGTDGGDPCHVAISPDGRYVCVANFADGRVSAFPLGGDGTLLPPENVFCHSGSSVHPKRQRGPHAHSILFAGEWMFVPDLGIDRLKAYSLRGERVEPCPDRDVAVAPGSGPRAGEWSADQCHFYLINELASSVTHMRFDGGAMTVLETVSTLPPDAQCENICADLHRTPDGRFLYASNRGHDSITTFAVRADGSLTYRGNVPCGGRTPRNFAVTPDGAGLLVGNQDSDTIALFDIGPDGSLTARAQCPFPTPVCIRFLTRFGGGA